MAYDYSECIKHVKSWVENVVQSQYLDAYQAKELLELDERTPDSLFAEDTGRPLIVAFMGGTGVGKSSLLNRLAGQDIARTGVERPTSREVTLYHHQDISVQQLPEGLPLEKIKISTHQNDERKNILWIDMPDFDSVEQANKQLVMEWLPHIDVLIYVVSPERYRDGKAWRLLLAEGASHAWLFVLNKWDQGDSVQYEDFKKQLAEAGFTDPKIYRTTCFPPDSTDEFNMLVQHLESLSEQQIVDELKQRGLRIRAKLLEEKLTACQQNFDTEKYEQLTAFARQQWKKTEKLFAEAFRWPVQQLAQSYADKGGRKPDIDLWDSWAQSRLNDVLDEIAFKAEALKIPVKPLKTKLTELSQQAEKTLVTEAELACRKALIKPGNRIQRFLIILMKLLEFILPAAALGLVGYQVFIGYYESVEEGNPFLGVNFVAHSILLILLSWLIPFFLRKKLQPSLKKTAEYGLQKGVDAGLKKLEREILDVLETEQQATRQYYQQLEEMKDKCRNNVQQTNKQQVKQLNGMLVDNQ